MIVCISFALFAGSKTFEVGNELITFELIDDVIFIFINFKSFEFKTDGSPVIDWIDKVDVDRYRLIIAIWYSIVDLEES